MSKFRSLNSFISTHMPIAEIVKPYVELEAVGDSLKGVCPFKECLTTTTPKALSFVVNSQLNMFYCFNCGTTGGTIDFHARINNLSQVNAIKGIINEHFMPITSKSV